MTNPSQKFGIYIHWPFCLSKCPYCDFFSQIKKNIPQDDIINEYISDLDFYHNLTDNQKVTSIFFGGGTPSLIKPQNIEKIISHIKNKWKCAEDIEISLEANPNTNHKNMFSELKKAGINRLSLGVQSLNDEDLKFLGRTHSSKEALAAADDVIRTFDNHSMDMIYALPHQNINSWRQDLEKITGFSFKHLSLYQLTIEDSTAFYAKKINAMEENKAIEIYNLTSDFLNSKGYEHYEISNFAKNGFEARHNLAYWEGHDYIGVGKSAHGRIGLLATTHCRNIENLTPEERAEELLIMGLRLENGINKRAFFDKTGIAFNNFVNSQKVQNMIKQKLVLDGDTRFKLTKDGRNLLNYVLSEIFG
ncbi:MAG: radical SAM family heme chaperone HemW [Lactobacillaceae bacterium]|jgi:oxygen-independent coproporphyrinogen-3 oxidase|nr:radical SAM family heme chaperone HemW [Lactobacillaceae bacterium]